MMRARVCRVRNPRQESDILGRKGTQIAMAKQDRTLTERTSSSCQLGIKIKKVNDRQPRAKNKDNADNAGLLSP